MPSRPAKKSIKIPATVLAAAITLIGTCITVICSSPILVKVVEYMAPPRQLPSPEPPTQVFEVVPSVFPSMSSTKDLSPTIEIIGPDTVPFREKTYFTFVSRNARRAEWSVGGFEDNEVFVVSPLAPSHQIFVEVTDEQRIGDTFIIAVTVYDENGDTATATKQFTVVER